MRLGMLLAVGLLLAACAAPASAPASKPAPAAGGAPAPAAATVSAPAARVATAAPTPLPRVPLVFGIPERNLNYIVPIAALSKGLFAEEGIDLDLRAIQSNLMIAAMQRGDMHISGAGGTASRAAVQGAPFKIITFLTERPTFSLVTVPEIRDAAQLAGKRVGVINVGDTQQNFVEIFARSRGADPREIAFLAVGASVPTRLASLQAGAIDATVFDAAAAAVAERQGYPILPGLAEAVPQPLQGLVALEDYLRDQPAAVRGFLRALVRALVYTRENPDEVAAIARAELGLELDEAIAQRAVRLYAEKISPTAPGYADARMMDAFYTYDVRLPLGLPPDQPLPTLHDFGPLLETYDALGIPRPR